MSEIVPKPSRPTRFQRLAQRVASRIGWRVEANLPVPEKCVIIGAHHTSGTDFLAMLLLATTLGIRFNWVAKDTLFWGPMGWVARSLGGIPVNRRQRTDFVARMAAMFQERQVLRLGIVPEGTRAKAPYWKTGFYYIALAANVPIVMGFADYGRKTVGLGPALIPTGDIQADIQVIREFYSNVTGRYPGQQNEIRIRE
jgi:1-acyl-sn-glycerol-3-phosphate acyltransferase